MLGKRFAKKVGGIPTRMHDSGIHADLISWIPGRASAYG